MLPRHLRTLLLAGLLVPGLASCSKPAGDAPFSGRWKLIREDGIAGQTSTAVADVKASGNLFRIETTDEDTVEVQVYDGKVLISESRFVQGDAEGAEAPILPTITPKSTAQVEPLRFWRNRDDSKSGAGGLIAGRETLLHQGQDDRPDGTLTIQTWVDAETGVVLKRTFTVYSSQLGQLVSKKTEECEEIRYGPVDESTFAKP